MEKSILKKKHYINHLLKRGYLIIILLAFSIPNSSCIQKGSDSKSQLNIQSQSDLVYQCPPCGCDSQGKIFKESGGCPSCGMPLIEIKVGNKPLGEVSKLNPIKSLDKKMNVAVFIFNGNQVLDYAGPYDVFAASSDNFNVYTVGATSEPIITWPNLSINPQYNIANAPKPDIIVIPAGDNSSVKQQERDWILESAEHAEYVLSVCNGAILIAELGLLDGLEATAHKSGINGLEKNFPKIKKVHRDKRYVDNGKVITSGGVSAGIDASFYLMSKIIGVEGAQAAANAIEYVYWDPKKNNY